MTNTEKLQQIIEQHGLKIDGWHGGAGQFRDLYIGTDADYGKLQALRDALLAANVVDVRITYVDNPDRHDHSKAMVQVSSFWWDVPRIPPNRLVRLKETGTILETISHPHGDLLENIQARSPGDPTTMETYPITQLAQLMVRCERDGHEWIPTVIDEFKHCHINCPICLRGYYAEHTSDGKFTHFESDRKLTILA